MRIKPIYQSSSMSAGLGFWIGEQRRWTPHSAWTVYVAYVVVWRIKVGAEIS